MTTIIILLIIISTIFISKKIDKLEKSINEEQTFISNQIEELGKYIHIELVEGVSKEE